MPDPERQYDILASRIPHGVDPLALEGPEKEWAASKPAVAITIPGEEA